MNLIQDHKQQHWHHAEFFKSTIEYRHNLVAQVIKEGHGDFIPYVLCYKKQNDDHRFDAFVLTTRK